MAIIKSNLQNNLTTDEFSMVAYYVDRADEAYDCGEGHMVEAILKDAADVLSASKAYEAAKKVDCLYAELLLN